MSEDSMDIILSRFYRFLVESIPDMVIKYNFLARKYETLETTQLGDRYVAASLKMDNFWTYGSYDREVLEKCGFTELEIEDYIDDYELIPEDKRSIVVYYARQQYLSNYVEQNNYYRMLYGLPDIDDDEEIWFPDESYYEEYALDPGPVHEIRHEILVAMETRGMLDELRANNPTKEYLNYLGARRIDIATARRAENFAMLYFPNCTDSYSFYRNFLSLYEECREYFMTVIFNSYYNSRYDEYENYIGFTILTMTINKMISSNLKVFAQRDFYDGLIVKTFLNAYGLYYDDRFTLSQMKLIAKNLNILLQNKSTDLALLDVLDLLGYKDFELMKYYLVKTHRLDANGNPVFATHTETDLDGTHYQVPSPEEMYDFYFAKASVKDDNVQEALTDDTTHVSYEEVTQDDPYWIEDETVHDIRYNTPFNYIETKYMDLTIIHRMYAIMFETVYFTRMILDKRDETYKIRINMAQIDYDDIPLFDVMVFLICLICKYYNIKPKLLTSPSQVLHILGFNYKADIDAIKKEVEANPKLYDDELVQYLVSTVFTTVDDINTMYDKIKDLDRLLTRLMNTAYTLESYRAYRKLRDTLMVIELNNDIYASPNGDVPELFTDYLESWNQVLYAKYESLETQDDISNMIAYVTNRLSNLFTNTEYLSQLQILDTNLINAVLKILSFFKSYTVDLRGISIVLLFDSRFYNGAHFYHKLTMPDVSMSMNDHMGDGHIWDRLSKYIEEMRTREKNRITERVTNICDMYYPVTLFGEERLEDGVETMNVIDSHPFRTLDTLTRGNESWKLNTDMSAKTQTAMDEYMSAKEKESIEDKIKHVKEFITPKDKPALRDSISFIWDD